MKKMIKETEKGKKEVKREPDGTLQDIAESVSKLLMNCGRLINAQWKKSQHEARMARCIAFQATLLDAFVRMSNTVIMMKEYRLDGSAIGWDVCGVEVRKTGTVYKLTAPTVEMVIRDRLTLEKFFPHALNAAIREWSRMMSSVDPLYHLEGISVIRVDQPVRGIVEIYVLAAV